MPGNTNAFTSPPYSAENTVFFTDESQLPTPVSGQIPLEENKAYVMYNDDPAAGSKLVTIANEILWPDAGGTMITSTNLGSSILVYTGVGNMFNSSANFTGFASLENLFMQCPNGTVYNIDGVLPIGSEFFPRMNHNFVGFFNVNALGTIKNIAYNINTSAYFQCNTGLILDHNIEALITDVRFTLWNGVSGTVMLTFKNSQESPKLSSCIFGPTGGETAFNFEPSIFEDQQVSIVGTTKKGLGDTYLTGEPTGSYTAVADVSTVGTVTGAMGTAFGETIFLDPGHGLVEGQIINQTGFSELQYNGLFEVLEIIDVQQYRLHVLFTVSDSGSWDSDIIQVSDVAHGLVVDDGVQLTDDDFTKGYDAGYRILAVAANTFNVNAVFSTTSTGAWSTNSITETDPRMTVSANPGIPASRAIGGVEVNGNAVVTVIALADTYQALNVTGSELQSNAQRFVIIDSVAGIAEYTGEEIFDGEVTAFITASKTGSTETYNFALSINQVLPSGDKFAPIEIKTTIDTASLSSPATLVKGDQIQLMGRAVGTSNDLTISDMTYIGIQG